MLVAAPSLALLPEASAALACSRRRWGLAPLGGVHLIGVVLEHGGVDWGLALLGGFHLIGCNTPSVRSNMVGGVHLICWG